VEWFDNKSPPIYDIPPGDSGYLGGALNPEKAYPQ
jgi:hypothetical protein